jgi:hypothetical protein
LKTKYAIAAVDVHDQCNRAVSISSQHAGRETTAKRRKQNSQTLLIDTLKPSDARAFYCLWINLSAVVLLSIDKSEDSPWKISIKKLKAIVT